MTHTSEAPQVPDEAPKVPDEQYDWQEAYERMHKRLDEGYPPAWIHGGEIGAELVGHMVGVKPAVPTQFGPVPVVTIATLGTGTRYSLWLTHTVLKREFVRQRPAVGELLAVRYEGEVRPESGGPAYENYTLIVDRPDERVDWSTIGKRYQVEEQEDLRPLENRPVEEHVDPDDIPF